MPRPSLLLITTSALRADALPCYGAASSAGAAICGIADRGALFVWAFTATPAVAPSAATLLTSQTADEHGVHESAATFLRTGAVTLAGALRAHGYATAAFIAAPELNRSRNLQVGFDRFETGGAESQARSAERVTERATQWIEAASGYAQPFFVWVHFPATSLESAPPLRGVALSELDANVRSLIATARPGDSSPSGHPPSDGRDANAAPASVSTGIAFAAVTGAEAAANSRPLDIERVRVPLLWSPPGGVLPQRLLAPTPLLDIAPTLLHSVGLEVPESFGGDGLHVGPLPPAAPRPARPLELAAGNEIGLVLSRRYYARSLGGALARTALLSNSGVLPEALPVSPQSQQVLEHERRLAQMEGASSGLQIDAAPPEVEASRPASLVLDGNALSPLVEKTFRSRVIETPSLPQNPVR